MRHFTSGLASMLTALATATCQTHELTSHHSDDLVIIDVVVDGRDSSFDIRAFEASLDNKTPVRIRAKRATGEIWADVTAINFDAAIAALDDRTSHAWSELKSLPLEDMFTRDVLAAIKTMGMNDRDSVLAFIDMLDDELMHTDEHFNAIGHQRQDNRNHVDEANSLSHCEEQDSQHMADGDPTCSGWKKVVLKSTCFLCRVEAVACPGFVLAALLVPEPRAKLIAAMAAILDCLGAIVTCDSCAEKAQACHDKRKEEEALRHIDDLRRIVNDLRQELATIRRQIEQCQRTPHDCFLMPHEQ